VRRKQNVTHTYTTSVVVKDLRFEDKDLSLKDKDFWSEGKDLISEDKEKDLKIGLRGQVLSLTTTLGYSHT